MTTTFTTKLCIRIHTYTDKIRRKTIALTTTAAATSSEKIKSENHLKEHQLTLTWFKCHYMGFFTALW